MANRKPTKPGDSAKSKKPAQLMDSASAAQAAKLPEGMKAKRIVTLSVMVIKEPGKGRGVKILDAFRVSKVEGKTDADGKKQKPATICTAVDTVTGEMGILIVNAVVQSNLERDYPDGDYVNRAFYIVNLGKRSAGQRYNDFSITEIEA